MKKKIKTTYDLAEEKFKEMAEEWEKSLQPKDQQEKWMILEELLAKHYFASKNSNKGKEQASFLFETEELIKHFIKDLLAQERDEVIKEIWDKWLEWFCNGTEDIEDWANRELFNQIKR